MNILLDSDHILEFDKILDHISAKCVSEAKPNFASDTVKQLRIEMSSLNPLLRFPEAREILESDGGVPLWSFEDVRILLNKIEPEGSYYLDIRDCQIIQNVLEVAANIDSFF